MRLFREHGFADEVQDPVIARYIRTLQNYQPNNLNYKFAKIGLTSELILMLESENHQRNSRISQLKQAIMGL